MDESKYDEFNPLILSDKSDAAKKEKNIRQVIFVVCIKETYEKMWWSFGICPGFLYDFSKIKWCTEHEPIRFEYLVF